MPNEVRRGQIITRRRFLVGAAAVSAAVGGGYWASRLNRPPEASVVVARAADYSLDLAAIMAGGLRELGLGEAQVRGKSVLIKPNLVEPHVQSGHINTHPLAVRGAVEAFLGLGAARVAVAEGAGHRRDSLLVLEESGLGQVLFEDRIPFTDLNTGPVYDTENLGNRSPLGRLTLPSAVAQADILVSLAKMKTHHWAGVTLSMKNLFGIMPGQIYGWPKNVLHWAGITESILDINATVRPHVAIVDGIIGMQGDGPIMGDPVKAGVLVMGLNPVAVDATCCRVMGVNPARIEYLRQAAGWLGPIDEALIEQRGEPLRHVRTDFKLLDSIPAQKGIRL